MPVRISPLVLFLLAVSLLLPDGACAMTFQNFGKMNDDDDSNFAIFMVIGTAKILRAQGKPDLAAKMMAYFKDPGKKGGFNQLVENGKMLNNLNQRNAINPNNRAPVYEVEDAMALTLKDYGIDVPVSSLRAIARNFHPDGPPRGLPPSSTLSP